MISPRSRRRLQNYTKSLVCIIIASQLLSVSIFHKHLASVDFRPDILIPNLLSYVGKAHPNPPAYEFKSLQEEKENALKYLDSIKSFERPLTFFHIPKTAGTAIENAAGEQHINWGSCMFYHKPKRDVCNYPGKQLWPMRVGWWHVPMQAFPLGGSDPYQDHEVFAVVRDPYDRMVSEFYYICTLKVKDWRPDQCDRSRLFEADYMNQWLSDKLQAQENGTTAGYLLDNGHFTPQYDFLVGPHDVRRVDYVLRLEHNLDKEFENLMSAFNLSNIRLKKFGSLGSAEGAGERGDGNHLGVKDLNAHAKDWIHRLYHNDFGRMQYANNSTN